MSNRYKLTDSISLIGNFNMGVTKVNSSNASLFSNFGDVATNSFSLGAEMERVRSDNDKLGFLISQPLRVSSGRADLTLPIDVATDGSTLYDQQRLNLAPTGRELDFETYYHVKLTDKSQLGMNAIFKINPNNDNTASNDATVIGKYQRVF